MRLQGSCVIPRFFDPTKTEFAYNSFVILWLDTVWYNGAPDVHEVVKRELDVLVLVLKNDQLLDVSRGTP
jgi:hypothetical protein